MKKGTTLDYKPTYKDIFSFDCFGWGLLFFGQMMTIISYLAIIGQNRWSYVQDDTRAITTFGLFGSKGDGATVYYYDTECVAVYGSKICPYFEKSGLAIFLLLLFTLLLSIIHAGFLATYRLGNAMWYKRPMLVGWTLWQGILLTLMALWWSLDQFPMLETLQLGRWSYDKTHYYAWLYPGFIYFALLPVSFIVAFDAEPAPGEEVVGLISGAGRSDQNQNTGPVELNGKWYSHKGPAPPPMAPPKLPASDEETGYISLSRPVSDTSPSPSSPTAMIPLTERRPMPTAAPTGARGGGPAPARPPPPKTVPQVKKWKKEFDDNYKEYYYVNIKTGESQWEKPADFVE
jgi:hypothetical protein